LRADGLDWLAHLFLLDVLPHREEQRLHAPGVGDRPGRPSPRVARERIAPNNLHIDVGAMCFEQREQWLERGWRLRRRGESALRRVRRAEDG